MFNSLGELLIFLIYASDETIERVYDMRGTGGCSPMNGGSWLGSHF